MQAIPSAVMITQVGRLPSFAFFTKYTLCAASANAGCTTTGPVGGNASIGRFFSHAPLRACGCVVVDDRALISAAARPVAAAATVLVMRGEESALSGTGETSALAAAAAVAALSKTGEMVVAPGTGEQAG